VCRAGDNSAFCAAKTPRPCGANDKGRADAPPVYVLRVMYVLYVLGRLILLFFIPLFLLCVLKSKTGRAMATLRLPVRTGRVVSPTTPDSCWRTCQSPPNPFGFRASLRSDGEKQPLRLQRPFRICCLNRDANHISITLMTGMMLCRQQIFIPGVRILPSETVRLHQFAEGCL